MRGASTSVRCVMAPKVRASIGRSWGRAANCQRGGTPKCGTEPQGPSSRCRHSSLIRLGRGSDANPDVEQHHQEASLSQHRRGASHHARHLAQAISTQAMERRGGREGALARREATLPPLERQLAIQRDLLTALPRRLVLPSELDLDAASGTGPVERFSRSFL